MPETISDAELVERALAGSQDACRDLVSRYAAPAVNLAMRMVQDRAVAEELAQEAFARAFDRLSTYDPERRFVTWFFQILHNVTIDHLRRKQPATVSLDEAAQGDFAAAELRAAGPAPDAWAEQQEMARAIDFALSAIRPEYREAVVLRYREELTLPEVAEAMGVPLGTVKTYLHRARKELAAILSAGGWGRIAADEFESSRRKIP